jgi:mono/diheme cytochrome c family protein
VNVGATKKGLISMIRAASTAGLSLCLLLIATARADDSFDRQIRPLLRDHCLTCHSTEAQEGELDLERFDSWESIKRHPDVWEQVYQQVELGQMPPASAETLPTDQRALLLAWIQRTLDQIARENAGDPGPVVMRRLSNHEYTYTLRDLTEIASLEPAREFPVDGAAGEGFTNVGDALVMSPALLTKYLDAAKGVAQQVVLLPDGFRFSTSTSPQDWTAEALDRLRDFYARYTTQSTGDQVTLQGIGLDMGTGEGRLPLHDYLEALQGRRDTADLSPKYLEILRQVFTTAEPSPLLEPLRAKFRSGQVSAADIESWQRVLWKFELVGHVGRPNGPQAWQVGVDPLITSQEFRLPLTGTGGQHVFLSSQPVGVGEAAVGKDDQVLWEQPRLVAKGRPDLPITQLKELEQHLTNRRQQILENVESTLAVLAAQVAGITATPDAAPTASPAVDDHLLHAWRDYLGLNSLQLEPLLPTRIERHPDYAFVQGWTAGEDCSVWANASENSVRTPGLIAARSIAVHPSPSREVVIAWQSPVTAAFQIAGRVADAHPECGNGVTWRLEVRRGGTAEVLAQGVSDGGREIPLGPLTAVPLQSGQVVALAIGPRDGNHFCDLTAVDLTISDGRETWNLSRDLSPKITAGNPQGPWHMLSQSTSADRARDLPPVMAAWRDKPTTEAAQEIRAHLESDFPLTHPLLAAAMRSFQSSEPAATLSQSPGEVIELTIPAVFAAGAEFVVTGRLAPHSIGGVQLNVSPARPADPQTPIRADRPVVVAEQSPAREKWQTWFEEFRGTFPVALCYSRIVPVDEVVTLWMYYREDHHLRHLLLNDGEQQELNRLWDELLYISQAPVKQVDAFEQIYQFATQDRPDLVVEFEKMREPIRQEAARFQAAEPEREMAQKTALLQFAARAWRRPLSPAEQADLLAFAPRSMLVRILASPVFLYRGERTTGEQRAVDDWELATRLSYFLWSSLPDEELRQLAAAGQLSQPEILEQQARRMLRDDRVRRLATEFGCQFLHVRDVATLDEKSERHFPSFLELRADMQEEVTLFLIDMMQNDRRVLSLLDADHSFLSPALAEHYGVPIPQQPWQRVDGLQARGRGGVLGFAATLAKHSGASRTSAILRGMWVSEVLLGEKTPNPPQGVPVLPETPPEDLTERQLIERHSSDPQCAGCHRRIDPYGFALEGFDAIGRLRAADTQTVLYDGTPVSGMGDLRSYLLQERRTTVLKQFSRKLLGYALGRSVQLSDQTLVEQMASSPDPTFAEMVAHVVHSQPFRDVRGADPPDER